MAKKILLDKAAREALFRGADILANTVKTTLGPGGRNAVIEKTFGSPLVTKDGVTVAREIDLEDEFENMGAQMVKEVASRAGDFAGDGTTTATVLAQAIVNEGKQLIGLGMNPIELKRGIDKAVAKVVDFIQEKSQEIEDFDEIKQVGTISANGDKEIGTMLAEAMKAVGKEGLITVEQSKGTETKWDLQQGLKFDRGFLSPYFITEAETQSIFFEEPLVLLVDRKIQLTYDILLPLEIAAKAGKPLLIVAEDVAGQALNALIVNKMQGTVNVAAVRAPGFGNNRREILKDIASMTGATILSKETDTDLSDVFKPITQQPRTQEEAQALEEHVRRANSMLGQAASVAITQDDTLLVGLEESKEAVAERVNTIRAAIEGNESDFEREKLQQRLAKLAGGVAVVYVGAASETEVKEKTARVDDALSATKAAVEEGIVPGGGVIFLRAINELQEEAENDSQVAGIKVVKAALEAPIRQICANAGTDASLIVSKLKESDEFAFGYDAAKSEYTNMIDSGIIDPAKVSRIAIQNAASVASLMLTTESMIAQIKEKEVDQPVGPGLR